MDHLRTVRRQEVAQRLHQALAEGDILENAELEDARNEQAFVEGRILMLEPRRLAARAAAERMASTLGEDVGQTVGFRIRGQSAVSDATRIEVVTEGILTRMLQDQPDLPGIGAVIFDEFHERSLNADLGLALCLEVAEALREADAGAIMPFDFLKLVWASLFGYYLFAEVPDVYTWVGASIIFASGTYIAYRENAVAREARRREEEARKANPGPAERE